MKKRLTVLVILIISSPIIYYLFLSISSPVRYPLKTKYFLQVIFSIPVMINDDNTAGESQVFFSIKNIEHKIPPTPSLNQNQRKSLLLSSPIIVALFILLVAKISQSKNSPTTRDALPNNTEDSQIIPQKKSTLRKVGRFFLFITTIALLLSSVFLIYRSVNNKILPDNTPQKETIQNIIESSSIYPTPNTKLNTAPKNPIKCNPYTNTCDPQSCDYDPSSCLSTKPTPTPDPQVYACDLGGACNSYLDPDSAGCPTTFKDRFCEDRCSDPSVRCNN